MKSLNEMGDALLAVNCILQRRKREREMSTMESIRTEKPIKQSDALPLFNMHQTELQTAKTPTRNAWNEENSFRTQLSHQRIEEFPSGRTREKIFSTCFFCDYFQTSILRISNN